MAVFWWSAPTKYPEVEEYRNKLTSHEKKFLLELYKQHEVIPPANNDTQEALVDGLITNVVEPIWKKIKDFDEQRLRATHKVRHKPNETLAQTKARVLKAMVEKKSKSKSKRSKPPPDELSKYRKHFESQNRAFLEPLCKRLDVNPGRRKDMVNNLMKAVVEIEWKQKIQNLSIDQLKSKHPSGEYNGQPLEQYKLEVLDAQLLKLDPGLVPPPPEPVMDPLVRYREHLTGKDAKFLQARCQAVKCPTSNTPTTMVDNIMKALTDRWNSIVEKNYHDATPTNRQKKALFRDLDAQIETLDKLLCPPDELAPYRVYLDAKGDQFLQARCEYCNCKPEEARHMHIVLVNALVRMITTIWDTFKDLPVEELKKQEPKHGVPYAGWPDAQYRSYILHSLVLQRDPKLYCELVMPAHDGLAPVAQPAPAAGFVSPFKRPGAPLSASAPKAKRRKKDKDSKEKPDSKPK